MFLVIGGMLAQNVVGALHDVDLFGSISPPGLVVGTVGILLDAILHKQAVVLLQPLFQLLYSSLRDGEIILEVLKLLLVLLHVG